MGLEVGGSSSSACHVLDSAAIATWAGNVRLSPRKTLLGVSTSEGSWQDSRYRYQWNHEDCHWALHQVSLVNCL